MVDWLVALRDQPFLVLDVLPLDEGLHHEEGGHVERVDEEVHRGLHRPLH